MWKKKTDDDKKPVEQEIAELQRKFRVLENDKRAYSEDSQGIIRKQRSTIEKLTRENRQMKQELQENRALAGPKSEHKMGQEKLGQIMEAKETVEKRLLIEEDIKERIDSKKALADKKLQQLREKVTKKGGLDSSKDNFMAINKQIRVLENRLDKALQKFNESVATNKELREQIDGLRRERVVFDNIYKKLEAELQQKKKEMANIIEQANAAYEARDSAQAQMAALKQQADKEHCEFEKEWRELGRLIENDKKMKEFMRQKETQRTAGTDQKGELSTDQESKLRSKVTKSAWGIAKDKAGINVNQEKVQTYEEAFAKIQAATGISDIDELVQNFINAEDQNFSLFNYANELSADIEKQEADIAELQAEMEQLRGVGSGQPDANKQKVLQEQLEQKWNKTDKKAEYFDLKYQQSVKTLSAVKSGIQSIFNRVGCTVPASVASQGITEYNLSIYLGTIEARTNEILQLHAALQEGTEDEEEPPVRAPPIQMQIKLPSTVEDYSDDDEDDDEDDQRPFTREELKMKSMRGLQKKQDIKHRRRAK
eukprot:GEMP01021167.1.p1 GENE.GEMP01021167.1~~GEMP01021167.1.p1  ORF type:complete len:541 (+),score=178.19 GEMP01021167.1:71-1693(+)